MSSDRYGIATPLTQRRVTFVYTSREEEMRRDHVETRDDKRKKEQEVRNYFAEYSARERRFY